MIRYFLVMFMKTRLELITSTSLRVRSPPLLSIFPHPFLQHPSFMRASRLGQETSRPAFHRKNTLLLPDGWPRGSPCSTQACQPGHRLPRFPLHHRLCMPNPHRPHIPSRPHNFPNMPMPPSTTNQQVDSARPPRSLRRSPSPCPSLRVTSPAEALSSMIGVAKHVHTWVGNSSSRQAPPPKRSSQFPAVAGVDSNPISFPRPHGPSSLYLADEDVLPTASWLWVTIF
jgi:hypothetical protein